MLTFTFDEDDLPLFLRRLAPDLAEPAAADLLRERGYRVVKDAGQDWITPIALSRQIGRFDDYVGRQIRAGHTPPGLELHRAGEGKRITLVRPGPEFFTWAKARRGGGARDKGGQEPGEQPPINQPTDIQPATSHAQA